MSSDRGRARRFIHPLPSAILFNKSSEGGAVSRVKGLGREATLSGLDEVWRVVFLFASIGKGGSPFFLSAVD
jgi:hypothetical protein